MAQVGRISGPLLTANLERNGIDLAFRNDLDTTQLLYLDVVNGKIGVNTGTPTRELDNVSTLQTINLIGDTGRVAGFDITNSTFSAIGNIELDAAEAVVMPALDNGTLFIDGNYISSHVSNANIDLTPHGTGETDIVGDLNVTGDLYTSGNITLEGTITFGDADTDAVDFNADVNSDIIPDINNTYNLGSSIKRWNNIYTNLLNGQAVSTDSLVVGLIDYSLRQGQIFYVAQRGTDTNDGDHLLAPVASIRRALELAADSNGNPVTVYVFPGDYEEETPLVIPDNVSVVGADIRNVNVFPTSYTLSEDVFHLNDSSTVSNLTVKNFYFDSNKGYAFRFAPDAVITNRSPYVQNVTVITRGSNVTVDDPLGFESGDAGRGAYVDGAELNSASIEASMLFHSVTMITPGVDAVTMTNGARVEWLNSFTYFANRGLYAFNNSTGRIMQDGSTLGYGAEIRSIGSANVYGNYGAVADGADCLMYLINHNFAYIGSGSDSSNDKSLIVQDNEVVEENSGRIYYTSQDQYGTFRVGDNFYVDFETGSTSIDLSSLTATSLNGIVITTGTDSTIITGAKVETGNIRFSSNDIDSLSGSIEIDTATGEINLNDDVNVPSDLDIVGNLTFGGNLNLLGDQATDRLTFNVDFDQNFEPNQDLTFDLGSQTKRWKNTHLSEANIGDIRIFDNVVGTNVSNADLELRASGTGVVRIPNNNVQISNNLNVVGTTTLSDVDIVGPMSISGDLALTGNFTVSEDFIVGQNLNVGASAQFEDIRIDGNYITTTSTNADLELRASGTGEVLVPSNNVTVTNNVSADNVQVDVNVDVVTDTDFKTANVSSVRISENYITTNVSNADLELRANGSGEILLTNNVQIDNDLTVSGYTTLQGTSITGTLSHTGNRTQTGNYTQTGNLTVSGEVTFNSQTQFENILIDDNVITTTQTNSDLDLRASGTGVVLIPDNNVTINNNLFAASLEAQNIIIDQDLVLNEIIIPPSIIEIDDNFISTKVSNADLDLRANGTGTVLVPSNNVIIEQNLTVINDTDIDNLTINGSLNHTGNRTQTGNYALTGNLTVNGPVTVSSQAQFENINIEGNVLKTTLSNSDIELRANNTGRVLIPNNNVRISNNAYAGTPLTSAGIIIDNTLALETLESSTDIQIFDNVITTTNSNSNLELRANGTGDVTLQELLFNGDNIRTETSSITLDIDNIDISSTGSLQVPVGSSELTTQGQIKFDSTTGLFEGRNNSVVTLSGVYSDDRRTSVTAHPTNNLLFFTVDGTQVGSIDSDEMYIHGLRANSVSIQNNTITTLDSNADLEITANGTGEVVMDELSITDSAFNNNSANGLTFANTTYGYVKFNSDNGVVVPFGTVAERPVADPEVGDTRWNTDDMVLETWDGNQYITSAGVSAAISEEEYNNLLFEYTLIFG